MPKPLDVLVVDDDPFALELTREALCSLGNMTVTCAGDGAAALRLIQSGKVRPDALVCDIYMPNMDGLEFLDQLARMHFKGDVIIVSGVNIDMLDMARQIAMTNGLDVTGAFMKPVAHSQWATGLGLNPLADTPMPKPESSQNIPRNIHVLVVDDDPFQLELCTELLHSLGLNEVSGVASGDEALARISGHPEYFQLMLIDLQMPGMDGFQFMESLSQLGYTGALVIVSGQSEDVMRGAALVAKLRRFTLLGALSKPLERAALSTLLARL